MICAVMALGFNPDLNADCIVNANDVAILLNQWDQHDHHDLALVLAAWGEVVVVSVADGQAWSLPSDAQCGLQFGPSPIHPEWTRATWLTSPRDVDDVIAQDGPVDFTTPPLQTMSIDFIDN